MSTNAIIVTYGNINDGDLKVAIRSDIEKVKLMAASFVTVIPDDPDDYLKDIKKWKGKQPLVIHHQDDDTFFFSATVAEGCFVDEEEGEAEAAAVEHFKSFVSENACPDDEG